MSENIEMGLIPHGSRIVIRLPEPEKKTSGGIIIPESVKDTCQDQKKAVGIVDAFGPDVQDTNIKLNVKIVYEPEGAIPMTINQRKYVVIDESAVIGILVNKK